MAYATVVLNWAFVLPFPLLRKAVFR